MPYNTTYMWNLKYDSNKSTYETETDSQTQRTSLWLPRDWGRMKWEVGVSRWKQFHIKWINNKVILYSTGNCIQYPVINYNGKEHEK